MKKDKLVIVSFLAMLITGCAGKGGGNNVPDPNIYINDTEVHHVEGTIHDFEVDYNTSNTFIRNKTTDYVIKTINDPYAIEAAKHIVRTLFQGFDVEIEYDTFTSLDEISSNNNVIVLGDASLFDSVGITRTTKDLGITGYEIQTKGKAVYCYAAGSEAYELIANTLLKELVGYDLLYGDRIIFERDGSVVPSMKITEKPDFDYRKIDDKDTSWRYGANFTNNQVFAQVNGIQYHTSFQFLPPEVYGWKEGVNSFDPAQAAAAGLHPKWFSDDTISQKMTSASKGSDLGTLCYTAHGDFEEYQLMQQVVADKLIEVFDANPKLFNVTFTIEDNYTTCNCESCLEQRSWYSDSVAATIVNFLNGAEDIVSAHYDRVAEETGMPKREYFVSFFAYHSTEVAPVKEVNGEFVPCKLRVRNPVTGEYEVSDQDIKTNERVCVFLAPISSYFTHSFYEPINNDAARKVRGWSKIAEHIYCWLYETNFRNYLYPFNTFVTMAETLKYIKTYGCSLLYMQDQHDTSQRSVFSRLKLYMMSKLMVDVNTDAMELINRFFEKYYGPAANTMRTFFDEMVQWSMVQEQLWPSICGGTIYNQYNDSLVWKENMLRKWENLCYEAIDQLKVITDETLYESMYKSILLESLFPRYVLLDLFPNSFVQEELRARQLAIKADFEAFGIDRFGESPRGDRDLSNVYKLWGIL
ncbi:MAG: DUF4838 domain-containing protein [Bacilli bacterium]|nr:DUF4838 domain-containing protein [Bacilli bacterium]